MVAQQSHDLLVLFESKSRYLIWFKIKGHIPKVNMLKKINNKFLSLSSLVAYPPLRRKVNGDK